MEVGQLLKILRDVINYFDAQGMILADGKIVFSSDSAKIAELASAVVSACEKNGIPIPSKVDSIIKILPMVLELAH